MSDIRDAAMGMECVKVSMSQTKEGMKITFVIHPDDKGYANDLFSHPVGSRYQMALVLLAEDGAPVTPKAKTDADRAVVAAGMLPREATFQNWLFKEGLTLEASEEAALQYIYRTCGISSRTQLRDDLEARKKFDTIRLRFSASQGDFP